MSGNLVWVRSCHFFQCFVGVRGNGLLSVSPMYIFLHKVHVRQYITFAEVHVKRSVIIDRLGPVIKQEVEINTTKKMIVHVIQQECNLECNLLVHSRIEQSC